MKQYNYVYETQEAFSDFLAHENINSNDTNILIQLFSSESKLPVIKKIVSDISDLLPHATLVGASTAGEIIAGKIMQEHTILSISLFEKSSVVSFCQKEKDSYMLGVSLSKKVFDKDTKCVITFLDGLEHNGQEYIYGLDSLNVHNVAIAGGMAADMLRFESTYTICGREVFSGGAVCVVLKGEDLEVFEDYNLGWRAVGPVFTITKSKGTRVYEIDHRPVKEIYAEVLGEFAVENMPASTIEFPLICEDGDMLVARSMLHIHDDGSISYGGDLDEGREVRFGIGSRTLVNQYNQKEKLQEVDSLQACFIYSCIARKMFLGKELEKTFKEIERQAPSSGFFTYGEFFFNEDKPKLLNITTTLLFLREKGTQLIAPPSESKEKFYDNSKTDNVLFHLIEYVTRELTEQAKVFRASQFRLDEFLKALESVVIISRTDTNGVITYVNERFEEISGYSRDELVGEPHSIIRDPEVPDELFAQMWRTIESGEIWKGEFSNLAKDGTRYYVKCSIIPIHNEDHEIIEYMAIREDVTSLVESRKKAEEAGAAQAMFLANMSHEIRTPMNGILGFSELLSKTNLDATQEKYVKVIGNSTKVLLDIVNDILDSSKITNKKIVLEKIELNSYEEFSTTYDLLKSAAAEKAIEYKLEIDEKISQCLVSDAIRLRQIKINLLSNAIKFTPRFGEVTFKITLLSEGKNWQKLLFSVEDSGIGIPKSKINDIFKPFSQADASTTRKFGGTGLGLSISSDLIKAFGSELKVESKEGEGSRFYFEMDFEVCHKDMKQEKADSSKIYSEVADCDKLHLDVLVAEDYDVNRMLIESIFEKYKNINLAFAINGKDAIEKLQEKKYDLVLMDINMPVLNGIDATNYIRQKLELDVPIVALTANALQGDKEKYLRCGMNEYLSKPIELPALENILYKYSKSEDERNLSYIQTIVEKLKNKIGISESVSLRLLGTFSQSLKEILPDLQSALELKDTAKIYATAHKLKGAAGALYIDDISELMAKIEEAANKGVVFECEQEIAHLYEYIKILDEGSGGIIKN
jgi:PAS domain S-box-containing protein